MKAVLLVPLLAAGAAWAEDRPVSPADFEALVTGQTLSYAMQGLAYGAEEYLDGRRVRWSYLDGDCQEGEWYAAGEAICFTYETIETPQCWRFYLRGGQLVARFGDDAVGTELYETARQDGPLYCLGPKVGA